MINNENCCLCFELLDIECTIWKCSECNWVSHDYCIYLWLYYSNINNICICPHCQRVLDMNNMPEYSNSIINIYNLKCCSKYIFYKSFIFLRELYFFLRLVFAGSSGFYASCS